MSAGRSDIAEIDAAIATGEWWVHLFDDLYEVGMRQSDDLRETNRGSVTRLAADLCRIARAVRLAVAAAMRLGAILRSLAALRRLAPEVIAAVRAVATAAAGHHAAAREKVRVRQEDDESEEEDDEEEEEDDEEDVDLAERESPDRPVRDTRVEALDKRLTVDLATLDFDVSQLRKIVERICADLEITPDWARWEARVEEPCEGVSPEPAINPHAEPLPAKPPKWRRSDRRHSGRERIDPRASDAHPLPHRLE